MQLPILPRSFSSDKITIPLHRYFIYVLISVSALNTFLFLYGSKNFDNNRLFLFLLGFVQYGLTFQFLRSLRLLYLVNSKTDEQFAAKIQKRLTKTYLYTFSSSSSFIIELYVQNKSDAIKGFISSLFGPQNTVLTVMILMEGYYGLPDIQNIIRKVRRKLFG